MSPNRIHIHPDLHDLVPIYLRNVHQDLEVLFTSLKQNSFETIEAIGHRMKGVGISYGFEEISRIGKVLETLAKSHQAGPILEQLNHLKHYLNSIEIILDEKEGGE
jgi:HPt (histidine-containing phosphotransfer) domain-containing protein